MGYCWEYIGPDPAFPDSHYRRRVTCAVGGYGDPEAEHPLHETLESAAACVSPVRWHPAARVVPYPHRYLALRREVQYCLTDAEDARLRELLSGSAGPGAGSR